MSAKPIGLADSGRIGARSLDVDGAAAGHGGVHVATFALPAHADTSTEIATIPPRL
jgi:hypothetical protein